MRLLFVSYLHPAIRPGGAQQVAYEMFKAGLIEGHDSFFICALDEMDRAIYGSPAKYVVRMQGEEHQYLYFPGSYDYISLCVDDQRSRFEFGELVGALRPDIVHFHHYYRIGLDAINVVRSAAPRAAIYLTFHEMLAICMADGQMLKQPSRDLCYTATPIECSRCFPQFDPPFVTHRVERAKAMLSEADHFIFPSAFLCQRYQDWGLPPSKCFVIPNGLAHPSPHFDGRQHSPLVNRIGFFGTLGENKGLDVLIEALSILAREHRVPLSGMVVDINGDDEPSPPQPAGRPDPGSVAQHQVFDVGSIRVRLRGSYTREQMAERMQDVDWVVVPSTWWEVFGLVVSESWMFGRPVLVSDIGGLAERVQHGRNGFKFPARDARALADLFSRLIGNERAWLDINEQIAMPWTDRDMLRAHLRLLDAVQMAS